METTIPIDSTAPAADSYLAVGTLLRGGRYRIERYLASGGFGKTYVARDLTFEKTVVIKEFYIKGTCVRTADNSVTVSQSDNAPLFDAQRTKFRKEAKRLYDLAHPNIVRVHDLFDENGTSYYTMDFVEGESLRDRVKNNGPLPEAQVWPILTQLLDALAYIHERHIWHLDIKPANVLVDSSGLVTLIDFGASKVIDNDSDGTLATSSTLAYTPGYAPLEQESRAFKNFGPWTDFYALGATLYSIVTANDVPKTSEIVVEGVDAFAFLPKTSKKLRDLIVWMMKPSHKERPQTAEAIRSKIDVNPRPSRSSRPPRSSSTLDKNVRYATRRLMKWWWAIAAVVVVAVGVGVWGVPQREHVPNLKFSCTECDKKYSFEEELSNHMAEAHSGPNIYCSDCNGGPYYEDELEAHRPTCPKRVKCDMCDERFASETDMDAHKASKHPVCGWCNERMESAEALASHKETTCTKRVKCNQCNERFATESERDAHKVEKHPAFHCNMCNRDFTTAESFNKHNNDVHSPKTCQHCNRPFPNQAELQKHMREMHQRVRSGN